jgi:hypothetical protein
MKLHASEVHSSVLEIELTCSSETSAIFFQPILRYAPQYTMLHNNLLENLKSNISPYFTVSMGIDTNHIVHTYICMSASVSSATTCDYVVTMASFPFLYTGTGEYIGPVLSKLCFTGPFVSAPAMKAYGWNVGIAALSLINGTFWVVTASRPGCFSAGGSASCYPVNRRLDGSESWRGLSLEDNETVSPTKNRTTIFRSFNP